jgi:hypothetical protein
MGAVSLTCGPACCFWVNTLIWVARDFFCILYGCVWMVKGSVTVGLIVENNIRMYLYGERISERIVLFGLIVENSMKLVISREM